MTRIFLYTSMAAAVGLWQGVSYGQTELIPEGDEIKGANDTDVFGWNPSLAVSGTLNFVDNTNAIGQVEGLSMLLGVGLTGGADYVRGDVVWRNEMSIAESFAKTPVVDRFIKTNDKLVLASTYNRFLLGNLGGFARGRLETSIFDTTAVTADPQSYTILSAGTNPTSRMVNSDDLHVASALKPLTLSESVGVFAEPIRGEAFHLTVRAGVGGRHTLASGVLVENDDELTGDTIELQELSNVNQGGLEVFAGVAGKLQENRVQYDLGMSALLPVINDDDYNRSAADLTRIGIEASASVAVFDWMGLVYKSSIISDPQLFPESDELIQYQTSLLLSLQYTLIDREKGMKTLRRIEEAEREKAEAEAKSRELEEQIADPNSN